MKNNIDEEPHLKLKADFDKVCECANSTAIWAGQRVHGKIGASGLRYHLAGAAWGNTIDLFMGMSLLAKSGLYSAALSLARPVVDSYCTGFWLAHIADEKDLNRFEKNYTIPALKSSKALLKKVAGHPASRIEDEGLEEIARLLNSLTHGDHTLIGLRRELPITYPSAIKRHLAAILNMGSWSVAMAVEDATNLILGEPDAVLEVRREWILINSDIL